MSESFIVLNVSSSLFVQGVSHRVSLRVSHRVSQIAGLEIIDGQRLSRACKEPMRYRAEPQMTRSRLHNDIA